MAKKMVQTVEVAGVETELNIHVSHRASQIEGVVFTLILVFIAFLIWRPWAPTSVPVSAPVVYQTQTQPEKVQVEITVKKP